MEACEVQTVEIEFPRGSSTSATIAWKELSIYKESKPHRQNKFECILRNAAGIVYPGQLLSIISSKPEEKSSLLQVLAYRTQNDLSVSGQIVINGIKTGNYITKITGYVHKSDLFLENISVLEHLLYLARLKMDRRLSNFERKRRVSQILTEAILDHAEFMKIKCLNNGERKRLSIASELLTDPSVLFCEDPTSNLDNFSSQQIIGILKNISANGKTVLITLDRPNSQVFSMLDQIMILGNTRLIYSGSISGGVSHFELFGYVFPEFYSLSDFFLNILTPDPNEEFDSEKIIKQVSDNFLYSDNGQDFEFQIDNELERLNKYTHSEVSSNSGESQILDLGKRLLHQRPYWPVKTIWLTHRLLINYYRDPLVQRIRLYQIIFIALIVGLSFLQVNRLPQMELLQALNGVLFIFISEISFRGILLALIRPKMEFPIYLRESEAQMYSVNEYFGSKFISMIPNCIIEAGIFTCITYFAIGLQGTISSFCWTLLIMVLTTMCGYAFGLGATSVRPSTNLRNPVGITFITFAYIFLCVSSGMFINLESAPNAISWIKYVSWFYYSFDSLKIVQYEGSILETIKPSTDEYILQFWNSSKKYHPQSIHVQGKNQFANLDWQWNFDVIGIVVIYIVLNIFSYMCLRFRSSRLRLTYKN